MGLFSHLFRKREPATDARDKSNTSQKESLGNAYLLLFSASWCTPSKSFIRQIEAAGINSYTYINVDENEDLCQDFCIRSIPSTLLVDLDGNIIKRWVGEDPNDPGQSKFVNYIKNCGYNIIPYQIKTTNKKLDDTIIAYQKQADEFLSSIASIEKVDNIKLKDGKNYTGYGKYIGDDFIPNGYGHLVYSNMNIKGNFVDGKLNGPGINNHDYYMYTMHFKDNRGNGWGLCINSGELVEFGYYKNSRLTVNLLDAVEWYYEKMKMYGRSNENMLNIYTSKLDHHVVDLLIGYPGKKSEGISLSYAGFHFIDDGSVWIGTTSTQQASGTLIKFCANGHIEIGLFEEGVLIVPMDIQEVIDDYYNTTNYHDNLEDDPLEKMFEFPKSKHMIENQRIRDQYNDISIDTSVDYSSF